MGIRESLLNTITSVGNGDFIRIVTSAGASSKATLQNVIKSFETGLGAKSSLTTSDYIRVVGSDNNLYKQSFSDVVDQTLSAYPGLTATADVTAWAEAINGYGITTTNGNTANLPSITNKYGVAWCNNNNHGTNIWCNLFWSPTGTTDIYVRQKTNATAWSNWEKMPTRAEIDALNSKTTQTLTSSTATGSGLVSKAGHIVTVQGAFSGHNATASGWQQICELPSGYFPPVQVNTTGVDNSATNMSETPLQLRISTAGAVQFYAWSAKTYAPLFCVTFII